MNSCFLKKQVVGNLMLVDQPKTERYWEEWLETLKDRQFIAKFRVKQMWNLGSLFILSFSLSKLQLTTRFFSYSHPCSQTSSSIPNTTTFIRSSHCTFHIKNSFQFTSIYFIYTLCLFCNLLINFFGFSFLIVLFMTECGGQSFYHFLPII